MLDRWAPGLAALFLVGLSMWFQGNIGLNLGDEGFLWYGVERTAAGGVPIMDFKSYDPGRYYWSSAWAFLIGDGIISLRIGVAAFQFFGLFLGLLAARRVVRSPWVLIAVGLLLVIWMFPRHKLFDVSIAMAAVYVAVVLLERPSHSRHFAAGVFVGLAAFFGRNHGVYNFLAFLSLILFIWFKLDRSDLLRRVGAWFAGIMVGYAPMLLMLVLIPGFFSSYVESVSVLVRQGATNLPLPVPWPWLFEYGRLGMFDSFFVLVRGGLFLLLPLFFIVGVGRVLLFRSDEIQDRRLLLASTCIGVFYMHYAFSRADVGHLAHSMPPLLLGLVAVPSLISLQQRRLVITWLVVLLLGLSVLVAIRSSPYIQKYLATSSVQEFISLEINGDHLWVHKSQADFIRTVMEIQTNLVGKAGRLFIAPFDPGLYPILRQESPVWDTYLLWPETEAMERRMIRDLGDVRWAIISDLALDGRDDLRFRNTHKLIWRYLVSEFEPVGIRGLPPSYWLLRRKGGQSLS